MLGIAFYAVLTFVSFGFGIYEFIRIAGLERVGGMIDFGTGRYNWLIASFYDMAGKWGVVGLFGLIGMVCAFEMVRHLRAHL